MDDWDLILAEYSNELRNIRWLASIASTSDDPHIIAPSDSPISLDAEFWSRRTHEIEALAMKELSDLEVNRIFHDVARVMDESLDRFDPIIMYFGRYFPDSVDAGIRMDHETEMAHSIKRDLAWIAVERVIEQPGFFSALIDWYIMGRWPCAWSGTYPDGHVLCL